jgi:oxaloacetate decarboxylase alpha subunit
MFAGNQVDGMKEAIANGESGDDYNGELVSFIKGLAGGDEKQVSLSTGNFKVSISR